MNLSRFPHIALLQSVFPLLVNDLDSPLLVQLTGQEFVDSVLRRPSRHADIQVLHATDRNEAKPFMTPTVTIMPSPMRLG